MAYEQNNNATENVRHAEEGPSSQVRHPSAVSLLSINDRARFQDSLIMCVARGASIFNIAALQCDVCLAFS